MAASSWSLPRVSNLWRSPQLPENAPLDLIEPAPCCELAVGRCERVIERIQHLASGSADHGEGCVEVRLLSSTFEQPARRGCKERPGIRVQHEQAWFNGEHQGLLSRS
jgi:hypothetical protein